MTKVSSFETWLVRVPYEEGRRFGNHIVLRLRTDDGLEGVGYVTNLAPPLIKSQRVALESFAELVIGADVHLDPSLPRDIKAGRVPTLNNSRYLLLEPPHHVAPPRFEETVFTLMAQGLEPVITHPERLTWVETHYDLFERLVARGAWMQVTAGAVTGRFGRRVKYWGERFLGDGNTHILATDAHHPRRRPPLLAEAREAAAGLVGGPEADNLVSTRPQGIVDNVAPDRLPALPDARTLPTAPRAPSFWKRLRGAA